MDMCKKEDQLFKQKIEVILGQENVILQKNKIKMTFGPNLKLAC
jgi:hypothetical protein